MFTGIIEEIGTINKIEKEKKSFRFEIACNKILRGQKLGNSISVNGCCLTIVKKNPKSFSADLSEETLKKTNLGDLKIGDKVNLEVSLRLNSLLGGHLVLGHVDTTGKIINIKKLPQSHFVQIKFPVKYSKYLIHVGSISVDGVSMTIAELKKEIFSVSVIPHTWEATIFQYKKKNDSVNLEFDLVGKYVETLLSKKK